MSTISCRELCKTFRQGEEIIEGGNDLHGEQRVDPGSGREFAREASDLSEAVEPEANQQITEPGVEVGDAARDHQEPKDGQHEAGCH